MKLGSNKQLKNNKSSLTLPVTKTKERTSTLLPMKGKRNNRFLSFFFLSLVEDLRY